LGKKF